MTHVSEEIASQPDCWRQARALAVGASEQLPYAGERVAVIGCGTSWFIAQAYAALRERAGLGVTDAYPASEFPRGRGYDRVVALTRSGTTTEVVRLLQRLAGSTPTTTTTVITADAATPAHRIADESVLLDFADERSVVQTRFATSALVLLRAHLAASCEASRVQPSEPVQSDAGVGHRDDVAIDVATDLDRAITDAEYAVTAPLPCGATERTQFTYLGSGWTVGLANEAALKMREASLSWAESYPAMEYRHGPLSITDEHSLVWFLGTPPDGLTEQVRRTGALAVSDEGRDPLAELVRVQRLAVEVGLGKGLDPDQPRNLTRSVVLCEPSE